MTAVVKPPRPFTGEVAPTRHAATSGAADQATAGYVGRHRNDRRAHHRHVAAATLAIMLAWIPAAAAGRGRHRRN